MPEAEIPPAKRVDFYLRYIIKQTVELSGNMRISRDITVTKSYIVQAAVLREGISHILVVDDDASVLCLPAKGGGRTAVFLFKGNGEAVSVLVTDSLHYSVYGEI